MTTATPDTAAIAGIIAEIVRFPRRRIEAHEMTADTELSDIGVDELDLMAIELDLLNAFEVEICDREMARAQTVGDLLELVERAKQAAA